MADSDIRIHIVGVGSDGLAGLTSQARSLLQAADVVLGSDQALAAFPELARAERVRLGSDLAEALRLLESNYGHKRLVLVATGDPLFYGVARYLCDRLGKDRFEVVPHVSTMQLAFARVKETWEEAYLTNLATHPLASVIDRIRMAETVGLFPSESEPPPVIARELLDRGLDHFRAYVCENLGAPDERVTQGELADIREMEFSPLAVMILRCKPGQAAQQRPGSFRLFGNPDDLFAQSRPKSGLITQAEVRAVALAQLDLHTGSIVWDVGAGSGSVAIEAAQLAQPGQVYAIEQDVADYHLVLANAQAFGVTNLKAIHGVAPTVFGSLPAPDAIFVGGTGHEIARLLAAAYQALRPGGRLVTNVATLESLSTTYQTLKELAGSVDVLLISVSRSVDQLETVRLESVNPTFLLTVHKPERVPAKNTIIQERPPSRQ